MTATQPDTNTAPPRTASIRRRDAVALSIRRHWPGTPPKAARRLAALVASADWRRLAHVHALVHCSQPERLLLLDANADAVAIRRAKQRGEILWHAEGERLRAALTTNPAPSRADTNEDTKQ